MTVSPQSLPTPHGQSDAAGRVPVPPVPAGGVNHIPGAGATVPWHRSHRADPLARELADRHYNRQKIGSRQFVPPGRCAVYITADQTALWVTSYPFAEYVRHAWAGAWVCSAFRNEGDARASALIVAAISHTRHDLGEPPETGMITFIDRRKVRPTKVRGSDTWGWSWKKAGFVEAGETKGGLLALQMHPMDMPGAQPAAPMMVAGPALFREVRRG